MTLKILERHVDVRSKTKARTKFVVLLEVQAAGMVNDHLIECFYYREIIGEVADAN